MQKDKKLGDTKKELGARLTVKPEKKWCKRKHESQPHKIKIKKNWRPKENVEITSQRLKPSL